MSDTQDPYLISAYQGYVKGDKLDSPVYGVCEFYRYNPFRNRIEVFDKYGIRRTILPSEFPKCQTLNDSRKF